MRICYSPNIFNTRLLFWPCWCLQLLLYSSLPPLASGFLACSRQDVVPRRSLFIIFELRNLNPISAYKTVISVIGAMKNKKVDSSKEWSINVRLTRHKTSGLFITPNCNACGIAKHNATTQIDRINLIALQQK